jgi:hypothetical protein
VLNADFGRSGYVFKLAETTRTKNGDWFDNIFVDDPEQDTMKKGLRKGGAATLNVYSVGFTFYDGLTGYSSFPWEYSSYPWDDGVVFLYSSVPGGTYAPFNLGRTLTHEVGRKYIAMFSFFHLNVSEMRESLIYLYGCRLGRFVPHLPRRVL